MNISEINRNLHRLIFSLDREAEKMLQASFGLTFSQFRLLVAIHHKGALCQAQIAAFNGLTAAAVSRQAELLRSKNLVTIKQDSSNRRQHILVLTAAGKKQTIEALSHFDRNFDKQYKQLSVTEQKIFAQALEKLIKKFCEKN